LINVCAEWSTDNGLIFSPTKSKIQKFNYNKLKKINQFIFTLNGVELETVPSFKYLGILLNTTNNFHHLFIKAQVTKAKDRLGIVRLLGFHRDGLRIKTAVKLYKLLVRPILEFACQVVKYKKTQLVTLEKFQCKALRELTGLHFNVKSQTVRLLTGVEPLTARFQILQLKYFHKLRVSKNSVLLDAIFTNIVNSTKLVKCFHLKDSVSLSENNDLCCNGYGGLIYDILRNLNLVHEFQTQGVQSYNSFSSFIKNRILEKSYSNDLHAYDGICTQSKSFKEIAIPIIRKCFPYSGIFLNSVLFSEDRESRNILMQILSGSNFITKWFCTEFKRHSISKSLKCSECPFCESQNRSISHFLLTCPKFDMIREKYLSSLKHFSIGKANRVSIKTILAKLILPCKKQNYDVNCKIAKATACCLLNMKTILFETVTIERSQIPIKSMCKNSADLANPEEPNPQPCLPENLLIKL